MNLQERLRAYRDELDDAIDERVVSSAHRAAVPKGVRDRSQLVLALAVVAVIVMLSSAVIGLVAHSGSSNRGFTIAAITGETLGESVRITSTSTMDFGGHKESAGEMSGVYDFDRGLARAQLVEQRHIDFLYVKGATYSTVDSLTLSRLPDRLRMRVRWISEGEPANDGPFGIANPFSELEDLRRRATSVRDLGTTRIDHHTVRHLEAHVAAVRRSASSSSGPWRYDLYVGHDNRLVRVVSTEHTQSQLVLITRSDFSDYGVSVDVAVPPGDQVVNWTDVEARTFATKLIGPWARVASGTTDGYGWQLFRAPADRQRECWSFETSPRWNNHIANTNRDLIIEPPAQAPPAPIRHRGHAAACSRIGVWASPLQYVFDATNVEDPSTHLVVGIVDDEVRSVASGSKSITLDPRFNGFVAASVRPTYQLRLRDGRVIQCAAIGSRNVAVPPTCPTLP